MSHEIPDKHTIHFGLLPIGREFAFGDYVIHPVSNFNNVVDWLEEHVRHDGYVYPSTSCFADETGKAIPNTITPGHLLRVPASHELRRIDGKELTITSDNEAYFIVLAIGLLYDIRLTYHRWWHDGRVFYGRYIRGDSYGHVADHFLETALSTWQQMKPSSQQIIIRSIWMHLRTKAYRWDFDQFQTAYMVIDAIYRTLCEERSIKAASRHRDRLECVATELGVHCDSERFARIVDIRNPLIHEVKWNNGLPGTVTGDEGLQASLWLPRLNKRLLVALLGYTNKFVTTSWWTMGNYYFDRLDHAPN